MFGRGGSRGKRGRDAHSGAWQPPEQVRAPQTGSGTGNGRRLTGEQAIPAYTPSIAVRSIDGHLVRTGLRGLRLVPAGAAALVVPLGLAAPRPDRGHRRPVRRAAGPLAAPAGDDPAVPDPDVGRGARAQRLTGRPGDVPGALSFDDYMIGEQQQLMGRSMAEKEVYLGVQVQTRRMVDRAVERAAPVLRKILPEAVDAELVALDSEVEHLDQVIGSAGLEGRPVHAEEMSWLMHRSCSLGLPAPRNMPAVPGAAWEPEDLASFTDAADYYADPYAPTVTVRGRTGSNAGVSRHLAMLTVGQMHGLQIPEVDDPWIQHADRLPAAVEVVGAHLRPAPGRGRRRAAAPDEQGALAGQALHRRARAGTAAVADPAGRAGAGDRRRDDVGLHRAGHPRPLLVAAGGVRPDRARRAAPGPAAAGAVQAEDRHRAPRGPVRAGPGVHPGRAAGVGGVHAPRLGGLGVLGGPDGDRGGRRPPRHPARRDVHGDPAPGGLGPVDGPGDPRRIRPDRDGRRPGWWQVVPRRRHRLQDAARRGELDDARPVRPAVAAVRPARAAPVRAADQPAQRPARHPQPVPGGRRAADRALHGRGRPRALLAPREGPGRRDATASGAGRAERCAAVRGLADGRRPGSCCCARSAPSAAGSTPIPAR